MKLTIEAKENDIVFVHVDELQIGADLADDLKTKVEAALPSEDARLAIDLSKVDFMDSSGLGALVSLLKRVRPAGGSLALFGVRPSVMEILRLTHLDSVFSTFEGEAEALAFLAGQGASTDS